MYINPHNAIENEMGFNFLLTFIYSLAPLPYIKTHRRTSCAFAVVHLALWADVKRARLKTNFAARNLSNDMIQSIVRLIICKSYWRRRPLTHANNYYHSLLNTSTPHTPSESFSWSELVTWMYSWFTSVTEQPINCEIQISSGNVTQQGTPIKEQLWRIFFRVCDRLASPVVNNWIRVENFLIFELKARSSFDTGSVLSENNNSRMTKQVGLFRIVYTSDERVDQVFFSN